MIAPYSVLCVQPSSRSVFPADPSEPMHPERMQENLEHLTALIRSRRDARPRLVVLPEFCLQGFNRGRSVEEWIAASVRIPGPESDELAKVAADMSCYIAAMFYEYDPEWPGRYWNTAFIVNPQREIILKYRKLYATTSKTRPGDVWTEYVRRHGIEGVLPVVDTEIGRLAALVCYDVNFPELCRSFALRGAEVLIHCTSEGGGAYREAWDNGRKSRAYENLAYLLCANQGPFIDRPVEDFRPCGGSKVVDFRGRVVAEAVDEREQIVVAEIDVEALRRQRADFRLNFLAQVQPHVHLSVLQEAVGVAWPQDQWLDRPIQDAEENQELGRQVIRRMTERGMFLAPEAAKV